MKKKITQPGDHGLRFGEVPRGWIRAHWADHLTALAEACAPLHPDKAARYRDWAAHVRQNTRDVVEET